MVWVDLFRSLPQLVVIIVAYFALPYAGLALSPFAATVLALGCVLSAFSAEIVWAAIGAVPAGQWDAARLARAAAGGASCATSCCRRRCGWRCRC